MIIRFLQSMVVSMIVASGYASASTILTFDYPPVSSQDGYGDGDVYVEGEYALSTISDPGHFGSFIRFNPFNQSALVPNNGSIHVGITLFANPWLQRTDGGVFSLESLDIAEYSEFVTWPTSVSLTGHKSNGGTVQASLALDGIFDGFGGVEDFQNYTLNWQGLVRVDFDTDGIAFDNIVVTAVPIPAGIWLFLSGLLLVTGISRTNYK